MLVVQFLGAANDNVLKGVLIMAVAAGGKWSESLGRGGQAWVWLALTVPFILFSGYAGQLADRHSKQRVTLSVKWIELGVAIIAMVGFCIQNLWVVLSALILLATQSAFFGPAKYGMIPELVPSPRLSRANGLMNMTTNIAVLLGTYLGLGPIYQWYYPQSVELADKTVHSAPALWLPGIVILVIAACGIAATYGITRLRPMKESLRLNWNPFESYWHSFLQMRGERMVFIVFMWSSFYCVVSIVLLILPDYSKLLAITPVQNGLLTAIMALSIAIGCMGCGFMSRRRIVPMFVPFGAIGMLGSFMALGLAPLAYWPIAAMLACAGLASGFFIIPLQAMIQLYSPENTRGRFLGTTNAFSFIAMSIGSVLFWVINGQIGVPANRIFLFCAILTAIGTVVLLARMKRLAGDPRLIH